MIERILNYNNLSSKDKKKLKDEVLNSTPRDMFYYIYYTNDKNKNIVINKLLSSNDKRYIKLLFSGYENLNTNKVFNKLLSFNDSKIIFYSLYDRNNLEDKYYIKAIKKLLTLPRDNYLYLLFYIYFIVLNRYNENIFKILKSLNKNITKDNYKDILIKIEKENKNEIKEYNEETMNKYIGHNNMVPDIIVCHISFDYGRILNNFYNESLEVSAHYVVSKDGKYKQIVSLENSSWANGTSLNETSDVYYKLSTSSIIKNRKINANYYTYSIEHESYDGTLTEKEYQTSLKLMIEIIDYIKKTYNKDFIIDREHIIAHKEVNPIVRKVCPGDNFPFDRFINDLKKIYNKEGN